MNWLQVVNLAAILVGPLLAVSVTLWSQRRSQNSERRLDVARKLLDTHHDVSQERYSSAIRLIPVEFRRDRAVLATWRSLMENVNAKPSPENEEAHGHQFLNRKFSLIFEVCQTVGIKISESEIRSSVYEAQVYADEKVLSRNAKQALIRIADALASNAGTNSGSKN